MANKPSKFLNISKKESKISFKRKLKTPITPNPFLNYFLSKCKVQGNSKLHRFAKRLGEEWLNMNYHEKTPYYQLADRARHKRVKRAEKMAMNRKNKERKSSVKEEESHREDLRNEHNLKRSHSSEDKPNGDESQRNESQTDLDNNGWLTSSIIEVSQFHDQEMIRNQAKKVCPATDQSCSANSSRTTSFHSMKNHCGI